MVVVLSLDAYVRPRVELKECLEVFWEELQVGVDLLVDITHDHLLRAPHPKLVETNQAVPFHHALELQNGRTRVVVELPLHQCGYSSDRQFEFLADSTRVLVTLNAACPGRVSVANLFANSRPETTFQISTLNVDQLASRTGAINHNLHDMDKKNCISPMLDEACAREEHWRRTRNLFLLFLKVIGSGRTLQQAH